MQSARFLLSTRILRSVVFGFLIFIAINSSLVAQNEVKELKSLAHKNEIFLFLVNESVVLVQWPHTLKLVNAPEKISLLNPGECIRVGVVATGDNRDEYLDKTKLSFRVTFSSQTQDHHLTPLAQTKQIKPEGGDFVTAALAAGGIKNPLLTTASMGVSADKWCVPTDAVDGSATVEAEVETPSGHETLKPATIQIESFETGSNKQFKNLDDLGGFTQVYYRHPNPARLLPALQTAIANQSKHPESDFIEIFSAFLSAALKADPAAAKDFRARVATQPPLIRRFGIIILRSAGYDISSVLETMSPQEQENAKSLPSLDDPYDLTPTKPVFPHLDLMWSTFGATGQFEPVKTIASTLSWRPDFNEFDRAHKAAHFHLTLTPTVVRGLAYKAAGWSLGSFQETDPLAADYIEYMIASPDTPPAVKSELAGLRTNPAFRETNGK